MELAVDDIYDNENNIDIVIIPPDCIYQTDEGDIDDDDIQGDTLLLAKMDR